MEINNGSYETWKDSGLLDEIDDLENAKKIAYNLEMMRLALLQERELNPFHDVGEVAEWIFVIIRRIMERNGYKHLNLELLYSKAEEEWEKFKRLKDEFIGDLEVTFVYEFVEDNKDNFILPLN